MNITAPRMTLRQRGFTILELLIAVSVMSLLTVALATTNRYEDRKKIGQSLGESFKPMAQALQDYVQAHRLTLVQGLPVTGVANAFQPTIAELRTLNFYTTRFPLTVPSNGGTPTFRIARIPTGCVTTACDLEYFVGNTVPELSNDGTPNEGILAAAAATVGATAGYSTSLAPSTVAGRGGWTYTNPNGAVGGIFGIYTTYSQSGNAAFVRIQDTRDPDLQGSLSVVGTTKAAKLQVTDTVTLGAACTPNGLISKDSAGVILSCQSGVWEKQSGGWKLMNLSDGAAFNTRCQYLVDGVQASSVAPSTIYVNYPGITSTTLAIPNGSKWLQNVTQYNYANGTDYGWSGVGSIYESCA